MIENRLIQLIVSRVWLWHALYFFIGGLWSVVGRRSFEAIAGPKTDYWLVRTVGGLLTVVGAVLGVAGWRQRLTSELAWLGVASSAVLIVIDVFYTARRRISPVYLLDAVGNTVLIGGWIAHLQRGRSAAER